MLVYSKSRSNKGDKKRQKFAGDFFYEINILERNITHKNKNIIKQQIENENIKINFINTAFILDKYKYLCNMLLFLKDH